MGYRDLSFDVTDEVKALGVRGVYLAMGDLANRDTDPGFEQLRDAVLTRIKTELTPDGINQDPVLRGFRDLHAAVGFSNRQYVSAPENLLTNLLRAGRFPHVNLLVDIYNLVAVETRIALGAHDIARVDGNIHLRMTRGDEGYWPIGSPAPNRTRPGGYAYVDDANDVLCMLEVRQVEKTRATVETRESFYIVQGNAEAGLDVVRSAANQLVALTKRFCGGAERWLAEF